MDETSKLPEGYSVSPNSGRIRKRIKKKKFFTRRKAKKYVEYFLWIILLGAFVYSLMIVIPELGIVSDKNPKTKTR
jgi:hypothetical protein